jgi:ABC-type branched-subunit amino acid transport system substrate-binding protein/LysM repeat protein
VADIVASNPGVDEKLEIGAVVKIPKKAAEEKPSSTDKAPSSSPKAKYTLYTTKQGDTFYSLERKFEITHEELISANPQIGEVLPLNAEIKIPSKNGEKSIAEEPEPSWSGSDASVVKAKASQSSNNKPIQRLTASKRDTFRIALLMPFMLDKNDSYNKEEVSDEYVEVLDSQRRANPDVLPDGFVVKEDSLGQIDTIFNNEYKEKEQRSIYPQTRTTMNFYTGLLLAVDTLTREGVKVRVDVYDTEGTLSGVQSILRKQELLGSDLIIGPRDVKLQKPVSAYSAKNQIPMVAPIASDDSLILRNQFYFQTTPPKKIIMQKTIDFVADKYFDKNVVVLVTSDSKKSSEWTMVARMREKILDNCEKHRFDKAQFSEITLTSGGEEASAQIKKALVPDEENVVFIPTTDSRLEREAILARTINALNALAKEFQITLIGMNDYPKLESINIEYFHQLNLHYLTPTFVDYNDPDVKRFVKIYREEFHSEPDQYSFRGYDIAIYFAREYLKYGKNYYEQSEKFRPTLLQETFDFRKVGEFCGYMNQSLDVVNFNRNWECVKVSDVK